MPDQNEIEIYTVGHSNQPLEALLHLLASARIETVIDVRRWPSSRKWPQYNQKPLAEALRKVGIRYIWMGDKLGGKRREKEFLAADGRMDREKIIASDDFQAGLQELMRIASSSRTAVLCAEENPYRCHRTFLICRALEDKPVRILHIRRTGRVEPHRTVNRNGNLFQ